MEKLRLEDPDRYAREVQDALTRAERSKHFRDVDAEVAKVVTLLISQANKVYAGPARRLKRVRANM